LTLVFSNIEKECIIYVGEKMKKIIIIFIVIVLVVFFSIFFLVSNNNKYSSNIEKEIKNNYDLKDDIIYLNKSNLYYIILTNKNLIVLDNEYQEVFKEEKEKINELEEDYEIVYRLNQVMYEIKKVSDNEIIYKYYDIYTNDLIDAVKVGG